VHVRVDAPVPAAVFEQQLAAEGFDVLFGATPDRPGPPWSVELIVLPAERAALAARGLTIEVIAKGRPFADILAEQSAARGVPSGYLDNAGILAELNSLAASYPALAQVVDLTTTYGTPATVEGRHLYALKISDNVAMEEDEPAFLMVAAHHCREVVTPVIALDTANRLLSTYATDAVVRAAVDANEIWIAPVWNPDGYNFVFTGDNLWRKNRRVFGGDIGVDQNRNYPFGWNTGCSGSTSPSSNTYKGPSPGSEAETQTMVAWSADRRFAMVLDFHSRGRETLWGYACPSTPVDTLWRAKATQLSQASGYNGDERPPSADGEHYQWQFATHGSMSFLTETHTSFQPTHASAMAEAATVWPGTLWFLAEDMPLTGTVTDGCSGLPLEATIRVTSLGFTEGEVIVSGGAFGRYHAFLPAGVHTMRVEATGYTTRDVQVTIAAAGGTTFDIGLDAVGSGAVVFCNATANSTGQVPTISVNGSSSIAQNQFTVVVERLPALQLAFLFMGQNFVQRPVFGGVLCIDRQSYRFPLTPVDLFGYTAQTVDLTQPTHQLSSVAVGSTWGFQLIYRDPAAGGWGLNYSPGLSVTFCP